VQSRRCFPVVGTASPAGASPPKLTFASGALSCASHTFAVVTPYPPSRCSVIFCEATAIYGVILAIILTNKTNVPDAGNLPTTAAGWAAYYNAARFAGYAIFWSGIGVGLTNLGSGCVGGGSQ
jgi:F0F1-type ATP synthase membrane subunit c/vacuolar-type H+-ATPase subunit K